MEVTTESVRKWVETMAARVSEGDFWWSLGAAGLTTGAAFLILLVIRFLFRRVYARIESWRGKRIHPIRFQKQEVLSADETTNAVLGIARLVALTTYLLLAYVFLNSIFKLFPVTADLGDRLLGLLFEALETVSSAVVGYLPSLVFLVVLVALGRWLIRIERLIFTGIAINRIRIRGFDSDWAWPTFKIVRFLTIAFLLVVAFPYLPGSASPAFQAVSVFFGVLVSLGSSGAVADVVSGIVLTYTRAFQIGDRVKIADAQGDVFEKTLFVTRVRTVKNVDITIPNALVMSNHIINFSGQARRGQLILHTTVTIGYDVPPERAAELLLEAARATEGIVEEPAPFISHKALDDFYVHYELNAYTKDAKRMGFTYSDLHLAILEKFTEAGVEIASPHLSAVRDGNRIQLPDDHLPKDYNPAAFRILPLRAFRSDGGAGSNG